MTAPLLEPDTILRELGAAEAPYAGTLCAGDPPVVWVDAGELPSELWHAPVDGHLLVPRMIARAGRGHVAAMPHCPARLADRLGGGDGAAVTIGVSIARAAEEADALGIGNGSWWVDEAGRPVLAPGGDVPWRTSAIALLEVCAGGVSRDLADALERIIAALRIEEHTGRAAIECEDALFALAVPAPLAETERSARADEAMRTRTRSDAAVGASPLLHGLIARHVDVALADRAAAAVSHVRERWRSAWSARRVRGGAESVGERGRRSRPLLVGIAVAAVVLVGGLFWTEEEGSAAPVVSAPTEPTAPVDSRGAEPAAPTGPQSAHAATRVVEALSTCTREGTCDALLETPGRVLPPGAATTGTTERTIALLDDYGGVQAVRVDAEGTVSQVVVLVGGDEKWLVGGGGGPPPPPPRPPGPAPGRGAGARPAGAPPRRGGGPSLPPPPPPPVTQMPSCAVKSAASRRALTAPRKRAASAPSIVRWSYESARYT